MDFISDVAVEAMGGLIVVLAITLAGWLHGNARRRSASKRFWPCRHDWGPIETDLGGGLQFVTAYRDECRKCGARQ